MRGVLAAHFTFSAPLPEEAVESVKGLFSDRGDPNGQGDRVQFIWSEFSTDKAILDINAIGRERAHNLIQKVRKDLSAHLGKQFRLGVRDVKVTEYHLFVDLEQESTAPLSLPYNVAYPVLINGKDAHLIFRDLDWEFFADNYADRLIKLLHEKIDAQSYEGKAEHHELLWSSPERAGDFGDPTPEMVKAGWLKQGPTKGKWFIAPQATAVLRAMERIAIEEVLAPLGFQEIMAPHTVPFEVWERSGHLAGVANEVYYIVEPKTRNPEAWEEYQDMVKVTRKPQPEMLGELVTLPTMGVCYAQCPVIYWSFQGETLAEEDLPILIYDRAANSNRYESGGRHGLERVDEFHRLEPVYIGTPDQMAEIKQKLMDAYAKVFDEILEIEWRMAWVTPFYMQQSGAFGVEDEVDRIKGTVDYEAYLPYRGSRTESEWLEFQNLTVAGDKFTKAFTIKRQKGELWSGCSGIGLERWATSFLAQKGLDPEGWPEGFRKYLPVLPKGYRFL